MSRFLRFRPFEWWGGKNICYRSLGIFYMVCQVIKGHALLLERVWGKFCNILNCTLVCDISEEHSILEDKRQFLQLICYWIELIVSGVI